MKRTQWIAIIGAVVFLGAASRQLAQQAAPASAETTSGLMTVEEQSALVSEYCQGCHNDTARRGGMTLTSIDLARPHENAELAEKIIKKLKTGLMPPATSRRRPERAEVERFVHTLETAIDRAAAANPNPGSRPFQRLTRDEYANSIREILGIEVDVAKYLPADTVSEGMDNIADSQTFSAAMMDGYMRAAAEITKQALGDPLAEPGAVVFRASRTASQLNHVPGAPYGTRGGIVVTHNFPADGEYNFRNMLHPSAVGTLFGALMKGEQLEVSIDGERVALLDIPSNLSEGRKPSGMSLYTGPIFVKAGPHRVASAFIQKRSGIVEDDVAPTFNTLVDGDLGRDGELTAFPHLRELEISGPYQVAGVSDNEPRRRVFTCRPLSPEEELPCASEIIRELARKAYRRPVTTEDMEGLMGFYEFGREGGDFEAGIRAALEAILVSPHFVFKIEPPPAGTAPGQNYRLSDMALASRLSYFLWGTVPDDQLISAAASGRLSDPAELERQTRRLLADPRSIWLSEKFAYQWLHLADLYSIEPDPFYYHQYDYTLAQAMEREAVLFFDSIVRENRSVVDLLRADYTFVNERLAGHYGLDNVRGNRFRRVELGDEFDYRRGLLGKGAILVLTSVADRTSPVLRGKWVMSVLLGTPPPPPPPSVPALAETPAVTPGKVLTVRERMELHRANPSCNSCHSMIDPIGLALENFDVTGEWRTWDKTYAINDAGVRVHTGGIPIDSSTTLFDGTEVDGPVSLRNAILKYSDSFVETLTEKLLSFAIGRRVESFDMPLIPAITRKAKANDNRFSELVLGIVNSPAFQMARVEPVTTAEQ